MQDKLTKVLGVIDDVAAGRFDVSWPTDESDEPLDRIGAALVRAARALQRRAEGCEVRAQAAFVEGQERIDSLSAMASSIAHEINNPLSYVVVNLEHLQRALMATAPASASDSQRDMELAVEEAQDGVRRVAQIVRDLQVFSAGESDRAHADVTTVLDSVLRLMGNEIRHRARLVREYASVPTVRGNPARLGQAFLSLLQNAVQALPEGSASDHHIRVSVLSLDACTVRVVVADTGSGVPAGLRARVFEPFFSTRGGSGLGLPTVRSVLASYGGRIALADCDRGARFEIDLEVAAVPERRRDPTLDGPPDQEAIRILVVDDEPLVARAVRRCLPEYNVVTASDGREAIRVLARQDFDLIFCDLMMPDMGGMDLHAYLTNVQPAMAERMVIVTGGAFSSQGRRFLERSNLPVLEKPFSREGLRKRVRAALERFGPTATRSQAPPPS